MKLKTKPYLRILYKKARKGYSRAFHYYKIQLIVSRVLCQVFITLHFIL